jgi:hypothetical protein
MAALVRAGAIGVEDGHRLFCPVWREAKVIDQWRGCA